MTKPTPVSIDDIRQMVDTETYDKELVNLIAGLNERLATLFAERDLIDGNPEIEEQRRDQMVTNIDSQARDFAWRLTEAKRRIRAKPVVVLTEER